MYTLGVQSPILQCLIILVNGVPTKDKKCWQQLVDLNQVRQALQYLNDNNEYYKEINIDENLRDTTEIIQNSSETGQFQLLDPATESNILDHYTIHPLHSKDTIDDALETYQMRQAKGSPISIWEKSIEARAFPLLFPTRKGGRYDDRPTQITASEYRS